MSNVDAPFGFRPVCYRGGGKWTGAARRYYVPSGDGNAIYPGDPVIVKNASSDAFGIPAVGIATAGATNYVTGFMVAMVTAGDPAVAVTRDTTLYRPASTAAYILVADDPDLLFVAQEDGNMDAGAASRNADIVLDTGGSTVTGQSGAEIDSSELGTGNTLQLRIIEPYETADNDPTAANARWLCAINLHTQRYATGI